MNSGQVLVGINFLGLMVRAINPPGEPKRIPGLPRPEAPREGTGHPRPRPPLTTPQPVRVIGTRNPQTGQFIPTVPLANIPVAEVAPPGSQLGAGTATGNEVNNLRQQLRQTMQQPQAPSTPQQVQVPRRRIELPPLSPLGVIYQIIKHVAKRSPSGIVMVGVGEVIRYGSNQEPIGGAQVRIENLPGSTGADSTFADLLPLRVGLLQGEKNTFRVQEQESTLAMEARDGP